jgi:hypothetical protein
MPTNNQVKYEDSEYKYSFSFNNSDADYIKLYLKIMEDIYEESKAYLYILIVVLLLFSIIGTISNLFTFLIFKFIFNKNFNRKIQSNLAAVVTGTSIYKRGTRNRLISTNNAKEHEEVDDEDVVIFNHYYEDEGDNKAIKLHVNFDKIKKKLIFSSNLKVFYTLIRYLALVDLFTCSFAIPVTVYEILYNMKINEFYCKLFEFMRSFGILLSNFLIVLIAIERYNALTNLRNVKKMFRIRISFVIIISILFGLVCSLQVSVYQKFDGKIIYTGVCMLSDSVSHHINNIVTVSITILFLFCIILLTIIYILLFKRIFELNSRYRMRKEALNRIFKNSIQYTRQDNLLKESTTNSKNNISDEFQIKKRRFYISRNFRLAMIILIVTFIYYLSIIPWCLTINGFIQYNPYIHYSFLLNNSVNPLVYGILNPNFRKCGLYLIKLINNFIRKKICQLLRSSK